MFYNKGPGSGYLKDCVTHIAGNQRLGNYQKGEESVADPVYRALEVAETGVTGWIPNQLLKLGMEVILLYFFSLKARRLLALEYGTDENSILP